MTVERPYTPTGPTTGSGQSSISGSRRLIGCVVGCLGIVVALFALVAMIWWWVSSPGPQVATEPIVPEDAVAALRIEGLGEDEGFTELAVEALTEFDNAARQVQEQQLPENLRWMAAFRGRRPRAKELQKWLPREITVAVEAAPETDNGYSVVTAVNLARYPRVVRYFVQRFFAGEEGRRWEHRGHRVSRNDDIVIGFVDGTMLISDDVAAMERAIDNLADAPTFGQSGVSGGVEGAREMGELAALHPGDWDVHGGFLNEENALALAWWDIFGAEEEGVDFRAEDRARVDPELETIAGGVLASWVAIDFVTADEVKGVLAFRCRDAQAAELWSKRVEADLERARLEAEDAGLNLESRSILAGDRFDVELQATEIRDWLSERIETLMGDLMAPRRGADVESSPDEPDAAEDPADPN